MSLFSDLGRKAEKFKQQVTEPDETVECEECGSDVAASHDYCPDCGTELPAE